MSLDGHTCVHCHVRIAAVADLSVQYDNMDWANKFICTECNKIQWGCKLCIASNYGTSKGLRRHATSMGHCENVKM